MAQGEEYESAEDEDYDPEKTTKKPKASRSDQAKDSVAGAPGTGGRGGSRGTIDAQSADPLAQLKANAKKSRIDSIWEQMKASSQTPPKARPAAAGVSNTPQKALTDKSKGAVPEWMISLGLAKPPSKPPDSPLPSSAGPLPEGSEARAEARAAAAAALAAAKALAEGKSLSQEGRVQVTEVRDFAGESVTVTRTVDPKGAQAMKRKAEETSKSGLDALLQQIEKKKKINILDKSRKDWGEYKEEEGIVEDLEKYKKSGDKYLDRVAFLQRAELKEYEIERDQRLAAARKKPTSFAGLDD